MARCLDGQLAVGAGLVEFYGLVYDVSVSPLEPEVLQTQSREAGVIGDNYNVVVSLELDVPEEEEEEETEGETEEP